MIPVDRTTGEKEINTLTTAIRLSGCSLKDDDDNILTGTAFDTAINTFLSYLSNLEAVYMEDLSDLTTVSFLKNCSSVEILSIKNTGVTTHNGDKSYNGLELILDSSNLKALRINNTSIDFSVINEKIVYILSSYYCDYGKYFSDATCYGLSLCNDLNMYSKLSDCSGFGPRIMLADGGTTGWSWDLSTESGLTSFWARGNFGGSVVIPRTVTSISLENGILSGIDISRLGDFDIDCLSVGPSTLKTKLFNTYNGTSTITSFKTRVSSINNSERTDFSFFRRHI